MAIIKKDKETNKKYYLGLLTQEERQKAEELLNKLKAEIPIIEDKLSSKYGDGVMYKYMLGKHLSKYVDEENIKQYQRKYFWEEINDFASVQDNPINRKNRYFYEYCYMLYQMDETLVKKIPWSVWSDLLDRTSIRKHDNRFFEWLSININDIKQDVLRNFLIGLNQYVKKKDTTVLNKKELFSVYDKILKISNLYEAYFRKYFSSKREHLTEARRKRYPYYKKKFIVEAVSSMRSISEDIEFENIYKHTF